VGSRYVHANAHRRPWSRFWVFAGETSSLSFYIYRYVMMKLVASAAAAATASYVSWLMHATMHALHGSVYAYGNQRPDLENIVRQSYDSAKVTIDLRRTSNLSNVLRRTLNTMICMPKTLWTRVIIEHHTAFLSGQEVRGYVPGLWLGLGLSGLGYGWGLGLG